MSSVNHTCASAAKSQYERLDLAGRTEGADGPMIVALLYEELQRSIAIVRVIVTRGGEAGTHPQMARARSILAALEAGLDFQAGGELSAALAGVYRAMRRELGGAVLEGSAERIQAIEDGLASMVASWSAVCAQARPVAARR